MLRKCRTSCKVVWSPTLHCRLCECTKELAQSYIVICIYMALSRCTINGLTRLLALASCDCKTVFFSDSHWAVEFRRQRTYRLEQSATSTTFARSVAEHLQAGTEDASLLIRPATQSFRDFAAAYKSADLLTYFVRRGWQVWINRRSVTEVREREAHDDRHLVRRNNESSPTVRSRHLSHLSALRACGLHPHT